MALKADMPAAGLACQGCSEERQAGIDLDPASDAHGTKKPHLTEA